MYESGEGSECTDLSEFWLLTNAVSTKISCTGTNTDYSLAGTLTTSLNIVKEKQF